MVKDYPKITEWQAISSGGFDFFPKIGETIMKKSKPDQNPWKAAGLVGALGTDLVVCLAIGYFGGSYLSRRMGGHKGWIIAGVLIGLAIGLVGIVLLIKRFLEDANE